MYRLILVRGFLRLNEGCGKNENLNYASLLLLVAYAPAIFADLNYKGVGSWVYNGLSAKSDIRTK